MSTLTPNLSLVYLVEGQDTPEATVNTTTNLLDALVMLAIEDRDLSTPPGSPANGQCYLVKATGLGAWAGHDNELAFYYGGWVFVTPKEGFIARIKDENISISYDGAAWATFGSTAAHVLATTTAIGPLHTVSGLTTGMLLRAISATDVAFQLVSLDQLQAAAADISMGSHKITNVTDPASAQDAATKAYVDNLLNGLKWKAPVIAASTANGTLATAFENGDTLDGVTLTTGDRILLKDQTSATENGIYIVAASGAPSRALDADSGTELVSAACFVEQGTVNADKAFVCSNNSITIGATNIVFVGFASTNGALQVANNLSDLNNAGTARTNLGLGTAATHAADELMTGAELDCRVFRSGCLEGTTFTCVTNTAYWVYVGRTTKTMTPKYIEALLRTNGAGAQTGEFCLASSPSAPSKAGQTLTKIEATGTLSDVTTGAVKTVRNTSAFSTSVPAGTHLWAGCRFAMATTQPTFGSLAMDMQQGYLLSTATPGALTSGSTFSGALIADSIPGVVPSLRVTLD